MNRDYLISNQTYDFLKRMVTIVLPGLAVLYAALEAVLSLPNPGAVVVTLAALTLCGGVLMAISSKSWDNSQGKYDGSLSIIGDDLDTGIPDLQLTITNDPNEMVKKDVLYLKSIDTRSKQGL